MADAVSNFIDSWKFMGIVVITLYLNLLNFLLTNFGRRRRATRNGVVHGLIWVAYQLSFWVPSFSIGYLSTKVSNKSVNPVLAVVWAPLLLLHLGGPDTITALDLEDNELWLRHLFGLAPQMASILYIFSKLLPEIEWEGQFVAICLFVAGVHKYLERTYALRLASLDHIRDSMLQGPNPGPDYAERMAESEPEPEPEHVPTQSIHIPEPEPEHVPEHVPTQSIHIPEPEHVRELNAPWDMAYKYFETFKGFLVDVSFSLRDRNETRTYFQSLEAPVALQVIGLELNMIYDVMYTKVKALSSLYGSGSRLLTSAAILVSTIVFFTMIPIPKYCFHAECRLFYDAVFTTETLVVFILLDFTSLFVSSVWARGMVRAIGHKRRIRRPVTCVWSRSVPGHNLIRFCLKDHKLRSLLEKIKKWSGISLLYKFVLLLTPKCCLLVFGSWVDRAVRHTTHPSGILFDLFGLRDTLNSFLYVSENKLTDELWTFIFNELKWKSGYTDDRNVKEISLARGDWILKHLDTNIPDFYKRCLLAYVTDVEYDHSLLVWHIATELCYNDDKGKYLDSSATTSANYEFSKMLSDYMIYLLVMNPTMLSAVSGIGKLRYIDTCTDAERFVKNRGLQPDDQKKACDEILAVDILIQPEDMKGDTSKSVLLDACRLARILIEMENTHRVSKWVVLSKIWVEMMSYGAVNCRAYDHAKQLCKGGELITFVWLLMAHLGLRELHFDTQRSFIDGAIAGAGTGAGTNLS